MARRRTPGRALCLSSALGLTAVAGAMVLLLVIQRRVIRAQRARECATMVRHARERCDLLRNVLLERIESQAAHRPDLASLAEVAGPLEREFRVFGLLHEAGQGIHALVVDRDLRPVTATDPDSTETLLRCAPRIRDGRPSVYTLPPEAEERGQMPAMLCYTCPIERDGRLLGGLVIHKELDAVGDAFAAVNHQMTWTVVLTQLVLLAALAAVAWTGHRAIARAERCRAEDERLAALGNLAAGIAHEVRNPLNTIGLTCRYLERYCGTCCEDPERRAELNRNFEIIASEVGRLTRTLDNFLLLARPSDVERSHCDLDAIVDDALALFAQEMESAGIRLDRHRVGDLWVLADEDLLQQVVANLIRNAIQAMDGGGTLTVTSSRAGGRAVTAFADTGPGISDAVLHHIFEPYFSTKRSGLGLGLALSRKIVAAHDGAIEVANPPGGGATLTVALPIAEGGADG